MFSNFGVGKIIVISLAVVAAAYGIRLLLLLQDVAEYQKYWNQQNSQTPAKNSLAYIALGDSTAQAIGASDPLKGYVGRIAERIAAKSSRPVSIINFSKSGATIRMCIEEQLPKLKQLKPGNSTTVTIEIGANDMPTFNEEQFGRDINELFSQLPKQTVVSDIPYFGGGRQRSLEKNVLPANRILREVAKQYGLKVAPLHEITESRDNWRVHSVDYFHPSNRGYINWADAFWQVLETGLVY
jgi:acyl-CoA thioesterase-1